MKCLVHGIPVANVILDPGASCSFLDAQIATKIRIPIRDERRVIEGVNGLKDSTLGVTENPVDVAIGETASTPLHVVNSRGSYGVSLGRDWLKTVEATADFSQNAYDIGGIRVVQRGRQLMTPQEVLLRSGKLKEQQALDIFEETTESESEEEEQLYDPGLPVTPEASMSVSELTLDDECDAHGSGSTRNDAEAVRSIDEEIALNHMKETMLQLSHLKLMNWTIIDCPPTLFGSPKRV